MEFSLDEQCCMNMLDYSNISCPMACVSSLERWLSGIQQLSLAILDYIRLDPIHGWLITVTILPH